jgi:ribosome-associated protein
MKTIFINHEPVELYKILKFESLVGGGGEAKMLIASGHVMLNGEVEVQKRKKIVSGDIIEFDGETYQIELGDALPSEPEFSEEEPPEVDFSALESVDAIPSAAIPSKAAKKSPAKTKQPKPQQPAEPVVVKRKRSSISF